jgi:peptidoglycan/LPS O-acetylase OafA/YrhL
VLYHFPWQQDAAFVGFFHAFSPVITSGWLGVDLFFVLSGFVIAHSYLESMGPRFTLRSASRFLWARFARVWPLWALVTCTFWLWLVAKRLLLPPGSVIAYQRVPIPLGPRHLLENLLMVQLWHGPSVFGTTYVGPGWSISSEWLAYVCFPVLVLLAWRVRRAHWAVTGVLAVAVMVPFAYLCYRTGTSVHDWEGVTRIAGGFTSGTLACLAVRRIPRTGRTERLAAVVCVLTVLDLALVIRWSSWRAETVPGTDFHGVAIVAMPVLVASLALSRRGIAAFLARPALVHGGRISYALYLVHMCLFEVGRTVMDHSARFADGTALGTLVLPQLLPAALLLAHLLHRFVEEPARRWLRDHGPDRWLPGVRPAPGAAAAGPAGVPGPRPAGDVRPPAEPVAATTGEGLR